MSEKAPGGSSEPQYHTVLEGTNLAQTFQVEEANSDLQDVMYSAQEAVFDADNQLKRGTNLPLHDAQSYEATTIEREGNNPYSTHSVGVRADATGRSARIVTDEIGVDEWTDHALGNERTVTRPSVGSNRVQARTTDRVGENLVTYETPTTIANSAATGIEVDGEGAPVPVRVERRTVDGKSYKGQLTGERAKRATEIIAGRAAKLVGKGAVHMAERVAEHTAEANQAEIAAEQQRIEAAQQRIEAAQAGTQAAEAAADALTRKYS